MVGGSAAAGGKRLTRSGGGAGGSDDEDEEEEDNDGRARSGGGKVVVPAAAREAAARVKEGLARRAARVGRAAATVSDAAAAGMSAAGAAAALSTGVRGSSGGGAGGGGVGGVGDGGDGNDLLHGSSHHHHHSGRDAFSSAANLAESLMAALDGGVDLGQALGGIEEVSVSAVLRLARLHSGRLADYALVFQNVLDDAAALAERAYACVTGQDVLASALFYGAVLASAAFMAVFGVGAGVFVAVAFLLRPPWLRAVPGVFGIRAFLLNLPSRSADEIQ